MKLKRGLSGLVPVRNPRELDYCWQEAVTSLLNVCDEVVISDSGSTDGTLEIVSEWMTREPRLRLLHYPWPNPVADPKFLVKWINWTREQLLYDMQTFMAADEVLCPGSVPRIREAVQLRECLWFRRLNFWKDDKHLVPPGTVCGDLVAQLGPTELHMPADEPYPEGEPEIRIRGIRHPSLRIFHYGFLRKAEAFYKKSRIVQTAVMNMYDSRLAHCEANGIKDWVSECPFPASLKLPHYSKGHPAFCHTWLKERGYDVT